MLKGILVGIDGSPYSDSAIELGIRWARQFDALLVGLAVIDEPDIRRPVAVPMGAGPFKTERDEKLLGEARRSVEQFLERLTMRCTKEGVALKLLENVGSPAEQIELEAQRYDLILLGKESHFHFETQTGPDDTLLKVLGHTPRPVVSVPLKPSNSSGAALIAYDASLQAARALQAFYYSGLARDVDVHIVSVGKTRVEAAKCADRAAEFLSLHDIRTIRHPIVSDEHSQVILEHSDKLGAQLLVMGSHGRRRVSEFLLGSVTNMVLRQSSVPVFLYH